MYILYVGLPLTLVSGCAFCRAEYVGILFRYSSKQKPAMFRLESLPLNLG